MARKNAVKAVWDRRGLAEKRGHGYVEIAVYLSAGQRKYIAFGSATAMEWSRLQRGRELLEQVEKYENIVQAMRTLGEEMTVENFDKHLDLQEVVNSPTAAAVLNIAPKEEEHLYNGYDQRTSFLEYMESMINSEDIEPGTRKHKVVVLDALRRFGKIVTYEDLTPANIMAFDHWLRNGKRTEVTLYGYHKNIKCYTKQLRVAEMIPSDPYGKFKVKRGRSKERQPLTELELKTIREAELPEKLARVRDLFIFSAYTGLAYCDAQAFVFKTMTEQQGGMYYIVGDRVKTGCHFITPILQPAMEVLERYGYELPKISNQKGNDFLHVIQEKLGINKPMTFHVARHSFATLCLAHDIPIENVARMLGHEDIHTTKLYAKVLRSSLERHVASLASGLI